MNWNSFKDKFIHFFLYESGGKTKNDGLKLFEWLKNNLASYNGNVITDNTTRYVLGFLFSNDFKTVVLIKKEKPTWQKGFLNGIGGKVEKSDNTFEDAMSREFKEETGMYIEPERWHYFAEMLDNAGGFYVSCYVAIGDVTQVKTIEIEEVGVYLVDQLNNLNVIQNLKWLIPMSLDTNITSSIYYDTGK